MASKPDGNFPIFLACIMHLKNVEPRCFGKQITLVVDRSWKALRAEQLLIFLKSLCQASEEASLRALESLMTEFFHDCTTNERKREIGKWGLGKKELIPWLVKPICAP